QRRSEDHHPARPSTRHLLEVAAQHHAAETVADEMDVLGVDALDEARELPHRLLHRAAHGGITEAVAGDAVVARQPPAQQRELRAVQPEPVDEDGRGIGDIPHFVVTIVLGSASTRTMADCYKKMRNVPIINYC